MTANEYIKCFVNQLKYPETLYVKKYRGKKRLNVSLANLKSKDAIHHIRKWLKSGQIPVSVKAVAHRSSTKKSIVRHNAK